MSPRISCSFTFSNFDSAMVLFGFFSAHKWSIYSKMIIQCLWNSYRKESRSGSYMFASNTILIIFAPLSQSLWLTVYALIGLPSIFHPYYIVLLLVVMNPLKYSDFLTLLQRWSVRVLSMLQPRLRAPGWHGSPPFNAICQSVLD